jgi:hypothetical protein
LAKICSDVNKPNGQFELKSDEESIRFVVVWLFHFYLNCLCFHHVNSIPLIQKVFGPIASEKDPWCGSSLWKSTLNIMVLDLYSNFTLLNF